MRPGFFDKQGSCYCRRNGYGRAWLILMILPGLILSACTETRDITSANSGSGGNYTGTAATDGDFEPRSCSVSDVNRWVLDSMLDYYLFYDRVNPAADTDGPDTSESFVRAVRVQPEDSFSYMTDESTYSSYFEEGMLFGYGWNLTRDQDQNIVFTLVDPESPLDLAGVRRGDLLVRINQWSINEFLNLDFATRQQVLGESGQARTVQLLIESPQTGSREILVTSASYPMSPVLDRQVIERNGIRIGYLHFSAFISQASEELDEAFSWFAERQIDELVLDLRFNGGGRISIANELASHIIGAGYGEQIFTTFAFNKKYAASNQDLHFLEATTSPGLSRLFVLQSEQTCSASELIINSLRPWLPVITVGATSCGKPYGSSPNAACSKVLNALEIELLNANGIGGYYQGIAADCPAIDNPQEALGNHDETLLATALHYIATGRCTVQIASAGTAQTRQRQKPAQVLPGPAWQGGNVFEPD